MQSFLSDPIAGFIVIIALFFTGTGLVVWLLRWLLLRFAPVWLVGPNGFLIDTRGGLGIFQMEDRALMHRQALADPGPGDSGGGDRC